MLLALATDSETAVSSDHESLKTDADVSQDFTVTNDSKKISENSGNCKGKPKHRMWKITVVIGLSSQTFSIIQLSKLSYFKARFSDRWLNDSCDETKKIEVFPPNGTNDNSTFNYNQIQFHFNCDDLKFLLKCIQACTIPSNTPLKLNKLESLLYCYDYFNPQSNQGSRNDKGNDNDSDSIGNEYRDDDDSVRFIIDENVLLLYFRNLNPPLDKAKRDALLCDCRHPLLRRALTKLNQRYENIVNQSQMEIFDANDKNNDQISTAMEMYGSLTTNNNSTAFIESLIKTIKLDPIAATKLFESRFRIRSHYGRKISKFRRASRDDNFLSNISDYFSLHIEILHFGDTYVKQNGIIAETDSKENAKLEKRTSRANKQKDNKKSILFDLWQLCENGQYFTASTFEAIDAIIEMILNPKIMQSPIKTDDACQADQVKLFEKVLSGLIVVLNDGDLLIDDRRLRDTKNINIKSCCQAVSLILARLEPSTCYLVFIVAGVNGNFIGI